MAVTLGNRSIVMTAAGDTINRPIKCTSIRLVGTGLTAGHRVVIKDRGSSSGKVICDHYVVAANEDADIFFGIDEGEWIDRPYLDTVPGAGTFTVLFRFV